MSAFSMRRFAAAIALGMAGAFTVLPAAAATAPPPGSEGPAGPPALMPNGKVAAPPQVTAPQVSTSCPAAPYGAKSAAPGTGKTVALTFDDGPGPTTPGIIAVLRAYGVPATFFNIGQNAAAYPSLVRTEASDGYLIGNHTWNHPDMRALPAPGQAAELDQATAEQQSLIGWGPCAFRPPYGNYNATTLTLARDRGQPARRLPAPHVGRTGLRLPRGHLWLSHGSARHGCGRRLPRGRPRDRRLLGPAVQRPGTRLPRPRPRLAGGPPPRARDRDGASRRLTRNRTSTTRPAWGKSPSGRRPLAGSRPPGCGPSVIFRRKSRRKEFG